VFQAYHRASWALVGCMMTVWWPISKVIQGDHLPRIC
jgi:hypothetical protein